MASESLIKIKNEIRLYCYEDSFAISLE